MIHLILGSSHNQWCSQLESLYSIFEEICRKSFLSPILDYQFVGLWLSLNTGSIELDGNLGEETY